MEGTIDEQVAFRLLLHVGLQPGPVHVQHGKSQLLRKLRAYNAAARRGPWLVLVDLDRDEPCAPPFRDRILDDPAPGLCLRIAVRAVEAWLLADRERMARFLGVPRSRMPRAPERVVDPKRKLVDLAVRSSKAQIRSGLVPRDGSGRVVGSEYTSLVTEFVRDRWEIPAAARNSLSLGKAVAALEALAD